MKKPSRQVTASLAMAVAAGFILGGYEFLRSPASTLYKAAYGKQSLPVVMAGLPFAVAIVLYGYARILSRLGARRTLFVTTIGSAAIIALAWFAFTQGFTPAVVILELFGSAYVVLLIEQYWSFINSALNATEGRRLNGPICGIASLGSIAAGAAGSMMTKSFGSTTMILFAAAATLPAALCSDWAYRHAGEPKDQNLATAKRDGHLGLAQFRSNHVLLLLLMIIVVTQVLAAFLSLSFQGVLQDAMPDADTQTAFSYKFYAWLNGAAAVLQFAAAPLLMRFVRPGIVHVLIPCLHAVVLAIFIQSPSLETAAAAYFVFKAVDYSVFRAAKEVLYVPLPFDARYRAKEVIDVFGYRFSKGLTAGGVAILQNVGLIFSETTYGAFGLVACLVWAVLAFPLARFYGVESPAVEAT